MDLIVVDERHRLPVGRPYLTVAIDVVSRCVAALEQLAVEAVRPMAGKPDELYVDNAVEFKSEALRRGCEQHGTGLRYRPPGRPHFGGIVERLIGTMMRLVHELPGTTFSNTSQPLITPGDIDGQESHTWWNALFRARDAPRRRCARLEAQTIVRSSHRSVPS
jgi:transposase InsO family protein